MYLLQRDPNVHLCHNTSPTEVTWGPLPRRLVPRDSAALISFAHALTSSPFACNGKNKRTQHKEVNGITVSAEDFFRECVGL